MLGSYNPLNTCSISILKQITISGELGEFFTNLTTLIENTYVKNGNTKVVVIAHSMGGPLTLVFLRQKTQAWKDKYIKALISLSGAYAGSVKALKVFAVGK